ncbi:MAG: DegT/DnrJ/EryC1/StrS family aminotransferase [Nitrospina sp.]|jgi:perosamine synthetase|nr:DegT/DnrJ/EryC1/StrS family aminotransferase [Nitrospina sp.]
MSRTSKNIDWWEPQVGEEERELLNQVLDSNFLNDGEYTTQFEQKLAKLLGCKHAVAVTSGTSALFLALVANGIGHGDEVIVPDITFIATANAVSMAGAKPVLVDVDPHTLNLSPAEFLKAITPKTKAVIPVHISGRPVDMPAVLEIAKNHGLHVIEDAAEALLSKLKNKSLGTFGQAGILSFSPNKTITTGQGGAILMDDDSLEVRLRELKDQGRPVRGTGGNDTHDQIGYNFKLTNLQAAIGIAQLDKLATRTSRMQQNYLMYVEGLKDLEELTLLPFQVDKGEIPQWVDALTPRRDELVEYLQGCDIFCRSFWFPLHAHKPYRLPDDRFPNSTPLSAKAFWLPSSFSLSDADTEHVCNQIRKFFGKNQL